MKAEQKLYETDPEFMERFEHFAYEEVVKEEGQTLDEKTRYLAILATLLGCQGLDVFKATLPEALYSFLICLGMMSWQRCSMKSTVTSIHATHSVRICSVHTFG